MTSNFINPTSKAYLVAVNVFRLSGRGEQSDGDENIY